MVPGVGCGDAGGEEEECVTYPGRLGQRAGGGHRAEDLHSQCHTDTGHLLAYTCLAFGCFW